jgi:hypothetical protein
MIQGTGLEKHSLPKEFMRRLRRSYALVELRTPEIRVCLMPLGYVL